MAQGTAKRLAGPAYIAASATNIYNPASTVVGYIRAIWVANVTASPATFTLYIGLTGGSAGGTEIMRTVSVPANTSVPYYFPDLEMKTADFLSGICETGSSKLTVVVIGSETGVQ
jgi:hypothetical protein